MIEQNRTDRHIRFRGDDERLNLRCEVPVKAVAFVSDASITGVFVFDDALWMVAGNNMFPDVWKLVRK